MAQMDMTTVTCGLTVQNGCWYKAISLKFRLLSIHFSSDALSGKPLDFLLRVVCSAVPPS